MSHDQDDPSSFLQDISAGYYGTVATENTIKCLYRAGASLDTTSTQIYPGESLLQVAFRSASLNGGLSVPTVLIRLGISIREKDLERAREVFQKFNDQSDDQPEESYTLSLQPFIESLDKRLDKPLVTLRLCSLAWEAALQAKLEFTFDVMAIDTRVTLSLGDLEKQAIAAIKAFNPQALQKIMSDTRFQAPKMSDDDGNTLLHLTLMKSGYNLEKTLEIARVLLNAGCNILRTNQNGQEPLHVWDEHHTEQEEVEWTEDSDLLALKELMEMITESSATCASRDARGKTALHHHIISSRHLQAVLDAQPTENIMAALETVDKNGFTPLALSLKQGFLTSASILTKTLSMTPPAMASPTPILSLAVNANATEILELLIPLAYNSDVEPDESPLHHM
ncbi:ankyrin repeat protein [Colletotrichum asianum]